MIDNQENQEIHSTDNNEQEEEILCPHCKRTATNAIQCKGICVADSDY
ncbi:hypothetical protein A5482_011560 [Cyanobacterium sp. IPPAS B-1200]|nr:hypothetical protein [Cyanobacterium sp. IPPAS B-1200]